MTTTICTHAPFAPPRIAASLGLDWYEMSEHQEEVLQYILEYTRSGLDLFYEPGLLEIDFDTGAIRAIRELDEDEDDDIRSSVIYCLQKMLGEAIWMNPIPAEDREDWGEDE